MSYNRAPDMGPGLRLHLNENTAGCSPAVLSAIRAIEREDAAFYPDYEKVTSVCASAFGVPPDWVQLTNGLDEGLHVTALAARLNAEAAPCNGSRPFDALIVEPAFEMYAVCVEAVGGHVVAIPPGPDFTFPADALGAAMSSRCRVVYLCDPNNPTGLPLPDGTIERVALGAPQALVLVDEAYADFSGRTAIGPLLNRCRNVIVGRTFAKAHGLAALRAGALVAHPDTLEPLRRLLPPYNLNVCVVRALEAALNDRAYVAWYVAQAAASRRAIGAFCRRRGLTYWPSQANFVLVRVGEAAAAVAALSAKGIFIRDRSDRPGCAGCVRITAGVVEDTARCLDALEAYFASRTR